MTRSLALLFASSFALAFATTGCSRHVEDPNSHGDGIDDSSSSDSSSSSECGAPPDQNRAIAISLGALESQEDQGSGGSSGTGGGAGGGGPDPSTIVLKTSNLSKYTCDEAVLSSDCSGGATVWEVSVELAPSQLAPGTFDLSDPALNAFFSITGSDGGNDCWGGGGSFTQGQLVIDSVDATAVHFRLVGTNGNDDLDGLTSDGMYLALRCN